MTSDPSSLRPARKRVEKFLGILNENVPLAVSEVLSTSQYDYRDMKKELLSLRQGGSKAKAAEPADFFAAFSQLLVDNDAGAIYQWLKTNDERAGTLTDVSTGKNLLHLACERGSVFAVRMLLQNHRAKFGLQLTKARQSYLLLACLSESLPCVRLLLDTPSLSPREMLILADQEEKTPLITAALQQNLELVGLLMAAWERFRQEERVFSHEEQGVEPTDLESRDPFYSSSLIRLPTASRDIRTIVQHYRQLSISKDVEAIEDREEDADEDEYESSDEEGEFGGSDEEPEKTPANNFFEKKRLLFSKRARSRQLVKSVEDYGSDDDDDLEVLPSIPGLEADLEEDSKALLDEDEEGDDEQNTSSSPGQGDQMVYSHSYDPKMSAYVEPGVFAANALQQLRSQVPMMYLFPELHEKVMATANPIPLIIKAGKKPATPKTPAPVPPNPAMLGLRLGKQLEELEPFGSNKLNPFLPGWRVLVENSEQGAAPMWMLVSVKEMAMTWTFINLFFDNEYSQLIPDDSTNASLLLKSGFLQNAILAHIITGETDEAQEALKSFYQAHKYPLGRAFTRYLMRSAYDSLSRETLSHVCLELIRACPQTETRENMAYRVLFQDLYVFPAPDSAGGRQVILKGNMLARAAASDGRDAASKATLLFAVARMLALHTSSEFSTASVLGSMTEHEVSHGEVSAEEAKTKVSERVSRLFDSMTSMADHQRLLVPPAGSAEADFYDDSAWHLVSIYETLLFRWHSRMTKVSDYGQVVRQLFLRFRESISSKRATFVDLVLTVFEKKAYGFFLKMLAHSQVRYLLKNARSTLPEFRDLGLVQSLAIVSMDPYWMALVFSYLPATESASGPVISATYELWSHYISECLKVASAEDPGYRKDYEKLGKLAHALTSGSVPIEFPVAIRNRLEPLCGVNEKDHRLLSAIRKANIL